VRSFDRAEEVLQGLRQGDAVEIVPDPSNPVNPLALQVRRREVGRVAMLKRTIPTAPGLGSGEATDQLALT
jgi:hypothetical protein